MLEWLLAPIDPGRLHQVNFYIAWHGRLMVLAWGILVPLGILAARFFKVLPGQNWPEVLDNKAWWISHLILQYSSGGLMLVGLGLVLTNGFAELTTTPHFVLGWVVVCLTAFQFTAGWLRGSKGGPTEPTEQGSWHGDHYDMSLHRRVFEYFHKTIGYVILSISILTILTGLWLSNAPVWMWLVLLCWWLVVGAVFIYLQRKGYAIDTYQAIWGMHESHPGNRMKPIGWGIRRNRKD